MGRKAWLFLGSQEGGATAAVLVSLTGSAKRNRAHPFFYLAATHSTIPGVVHDRGLLPHLKKACRAAPLTEEQRRGCRAANGQSIPRLLRCHTRRWPDAFRDTM